MTLSWYGLSSFKITTTGGDFTIITDPFSKESGLTPPRGAANIVFISKDESLFNNVDGITGSPLVIRNPGEFDVSGVHIRGIADEGRATTLYHLEADGVKVGFLGAFSGRELSQQQLEELDGVDVLILPVGGRERVSNWEWASHIVQQLEPKFIVPCFYNQPGLKFQLDGPEKFIKELGGQVREEERLTLKAKDVSVETVEVVKLSPQR